MVLQGLKIHAKDFHLHIYFSILLQVYFVALERFPLKSNIFEVCTSEISLFLVTLFKWTLTLHW